MNLKSVLIVDDNPDDRFVLARLLKKGKMTDCIFEKGNGAEALEFLQNFEKYSAENPGKLPPTVIFLDINMPIMNGFEFLEEFRKLCEGTDIYKSTVLTMFTSSHFDDDINRAMNYDSVKGYIIKHPESVEEFKASVEKYLSEN